MLFFKYVDIFDSKFHFYIENQSAHHSILGGIMTLSFLLLSIGAFILFEYDEIFKLNPISAKSEINYGYDSSKENLEKGKIWIPWRMTTYGEKFIDHRGILFPIIYSVKGTKNKNNEMDLKYRELNYKLCNETSMINKTDNYRIDVNLNELFCIDDEFSTIGGSWDKEEVYYIEINLYLCQNGINFNISDPRCQNFNNLLTYENASWLFEFFYPIVQFQPTDKKVPILVAYKSYYYRLSSSASKVKRLYLKKNILSDDQKIIGSKPKNSTYWGMSNLYGDSYFLSTEPDPLTKSSSSRLYSFNIYKDQGLIFYTRSYKKLLTIVSDIFPILNIIFIIFKIIHGKIKSIYLKRNLMELLFEISSQKNTSISNKEININNIIQSKISKINSFPNKKPLKMQKLNLKSCFKRKSIELINSNKDGLFHDKSSQLMNLDKLNSRVLSSFELNEIKNKNKIIKQLIKYPKKNQDCGMGFNSSKAINIEKIMNMKSSDMKYITPRKKLFPLYYYFMDVFLDVIRQPKKFCIVSQQYLTAYNFMSQLYDISTYVLLYEQFNIIRKAFYSKFHGSFSLTKKINILNDEVMLNINENLRNKKSAIFSDKLLIHY